MMVIHNDDEHKLAVMQVGVMLAPFYPNGNLPKALDEIIKVAFDNLGVVIERGDRWTDIRDRIRDAIDLDRHSVMEFI